MRRAARFFLLLVLGIAAPAAQALLAQSVPTAEKPGLEGRYGARLAAFEEMVRKQMTADHTTGLAIALLTGDEVWARAYGLADVENGSPMKPESSFRLASITKPMTATAILQLVEQGKIDLDAEIHPNRSSDIADVARNSCSQGDRPRALEAAKLNSELYPDSAAPAVYPAGAQLCFGDSSQARALLQRARGLDDAETYTSPGFLNGMAYDLAGLGRLDGATELLRIAVELHPKEANLYDSLGELELKAGRSEAAVAAYKKALGIDPKFESSIKALEAIQRKEK